MPDGLVGTTVKDATDRLSAGDVRVTKVTVPAAGKRGPGAVDLAHGRQPDPDGVVVLVVGGAAKGGSGGAADPARGCFPSTRGTRRNAVASGPGLDYGRGVTANTQTARPRTDVDRIAETYFDAAVALSPINATSLGVPGGEEDLDDLSPAGNAAASELRRTTLGALATAVPADDVDRVTVDAMTERLQLAEDRYAAGLDEMSLNVLASPLQSVRDVFDLMPQDTVADWRVFATRMGKIPAALEGYRERCSVRRAGQVSPRRQVEACVRAVRATSPPTTATSPRSWPAPPSTTHRSRTTSSRRSRPPPGLPPRHTAPWPTWLEHELLPHAPEADACGGSATPSSRATSSAPTVDLDETYAWGREELRGSHDEMSETAERILPGADVDEAVAHLDADPRVRAARHRRAPRLDAGAAPTRSSPTLAGRALRHPRAGAAASSA